jgi:hypothetical protein
MRCEGNGSQTGRLHCEAPEGRYLRSVVKRRALTQWRGRVRRGRKRRWGRVPRPKGVFWRHDGQSCRRRTRPRAAGRDSHNESSREVLGSSTCAMRLETSPTSQRSTEAATAHSILVAQGGVVTSTQRAEAAIRLLPSARSRARIKTEVEKRLCLQRVWGRALAKLDCPAPANHGRHRPTRQGPHAASLLGGKKSAAMARWWDVPHNDARNTSTDPLCCNINACYSTASPIIAVDLISGANAGVICPSCLAGLLCS